MHVLIKNDSVMECAHESYKEFTSNDEIFEIYEASNIAYAREQGIEQGIEETAGKMLKEGLDIELIARVTNISEDRLFELRDKIGE